MTTRIHNPNTEQESWLEDEAQKVAYIEANLHKLPPDNQGFARTLCQWYNDKEFFTPKQLVHVIKFYHQIKDAPTFMQVEASKVFCPEIPKMLALASQKLKFPSIKFWLTTSDFLKFTLSTKRPVVLIYLSNNQMTNQQQPQSSYLGSIDERDGMIAFSSNTSDPMRKLIEEVAEKPAEAFAINGRSYHHCCFCGIELTTKESITAGYGPICAGNYGLPWGESSSGITNILPDLL